MRVVNKSGALVGSRSMPALATNAHILANGGCANGVVADGSAREEGGSLDDWDTLTGARLSATSSPSPAASHIATGVQRQRFFTYSDVLALADQAAAHAALAGGGRELAVNLGAG